MHKYWPSKPIYSKLITKFKILDWTKHKYNNLYIMHILYPDTCLVFLMNLSVNISCKKHAMVLIETYRIQMSNNIIVDYTLYSSSKLLDIRRLMFRFWHDWIFSQSSLTPSYSPVILRIWEFENRLLFYIKNQYMWKIQYLFYSMIIFGV